jgi:signal transduction histidine kinase/type II secretory pathway pseudopilin PulG
MFVSKYLLSKNLTWVLVVSITIIIVTTLFIAIEVYQFAARETKTTQSKQQLEMARTASQGIRYFLQHLSVDLDLLTSYLRIQNIKSKRWKSSLDYFHQHAIQEAVRITFVVGKDNNLIYSKGDSLPLWVTPLLQKRIEASLTDLERDGVWFSQVLRYDPGDSSSGLCFVILEPLVRYIEERRGYAGSNEFVGIAGLLVSFDWLMQKFILPIQIGETGFAWVMDQYGRLLFHPRHPEMVLRSIYRQESACRGCHNSFDMQADMIQDRFQYQEYQVGHESAKIMAQSPMTVFNEKWIIIVTIELAEVTAIIRNNFRLFFLLVSLALTSIILGGILLLFVNIRRVQAEAHARHSEEKRLLQEQIHQSTKLASIGELVDSVAHEVNTPVGIISAQVDALMLHKKNLPYADTLKIIQGQTHRIANYTKSLLRFSRRRPFQPESTDLVDMTEECLTLLGHRVRANKIKVKKVWPKNLPPVMVDRNQMQQVLLNLLNNALDALNGQGEIGIMINKTDSENGVPGIEIIVSDNGPGIKPEDLSRIFDPFFSTKPPGKGTGLGLVIAQAIVKRHGGCIRAESKEGNGACFTVFIPTNVSG